MTSPCSASSPLTRSTQSSIGRSVFGCRMLVQAARKGSRQRATETNFISVASEGTMDNPPRQKLPVRWTNSLPPRTVAVRAFPPVPRTYRRRRRASLKLDFNPTSPTRDEVVDDSANYSDDETDDAVQDWGKERGASSHCHQRSALVRGKLRR